MITCCPACSTLFKVGSEQLRIAGGWVRCGQCMTVFDARTRMLPADPYVPNDLDWPEETAAPPAPADWMVRTEPRPVVARHTGRAVNRPIPDTAKSEDPPRPAPAAEVPAFAPPAFELVPPPAPEQPATVPVFIGKLPVRTVEHKPLPADQAHDQDTASTPPGPTPLQPASPEPARSVPEPSVPEPPAIRNCSDPTLNRVEQAGQQVIIRVVMARWGSSE
jgi:predicted Zn finger-like uncharacterized protein